jgi:hypothetical protein
MRLLVGVAAGAAAGMWAYGVMRRATPQAITIAAPLADVWAFAIDEALQPRGMHATLRACEGGTRVVSWGGDLSDERRWLLSLKEHAEELAAISQHQMQIPELVP